MKPLVRLLPLALLLCVSYRGIAQSCPCPSLDTLRKNPNAISIYKTQAISLISSPALYMAGGKSAFWSVKQGNNPEATARNLRTAVATAKRDSLPLNKADWKYIQDSIPESIQQIDFPATEALILCRIACAIQDSMARIYTAAQASANRLDSLSIQLAGLQNRSQDLIYVQFGLGAVILLLILLAVGFFAMLRRFKTLGGELSSSRSRTQEADQEADNNFINRQESTNQPVDYRVDTSNKKLSPQKRNFKGPQSLQPKYPNTFNRKGGSKASDDHKKKQKNTPIVPANVPKSLPEPALVLFAEAPQGKNFNRIRNSATSTTYYRIALANEQDTVGWFTITDDVNARQELLSATTFDGLRQVCDLNGIGDIPADRVRITEGEVQKQDGIWRVTKNIRLDW